LASRAVTPKVKVGISEMIAKKILGNAIKSQGHFSLTAS